MFVDVGAAADGWYSIKAVKLNPQLKAIALEPDPQEYGYLLRNVWGNGLQGSIMPLNLGLSDAEYTEGDMRFTTLDSLLRRLSGWDDVRIIELDVEGFASKVLRGAMETIRTRRLWIFVEAHDREEVKAVYSLRGMGYGILALPGLMYVAKPSIR